MKFKLFIGFLLSFLATTSLYANLNKENTIYENAVKDTTAVTKRYFEDPKSLKNGKTIYLNGYVVMLDVTRFPETKIVKASAIGLKNGLDIDFIKYLNSDYIVYGIEKREAEAVFLKNTLSKYGLKPVVKKINDEFNTTILVAQDLTYTIKNTIADLFKQKDKRIEKLEKALSLNSSSVVNSNVKKVTPKTTVKKIVLNLDKLQVVNRVVTTKFVKKFKLRNSDLKPLNKKAKSKITKEKVKKQIKTVEANIKKDVKKPLPKITNFSRMYTYLRGHAGITKENYLILHGDAYKVGDKLLKWKISYVDYKKGIVVLNNNYNVQISKKDQRSNCSNIHTMCCSIYSCTS